MRLRLLLRGACSPFPAAVRRPTAKLSAQRNALVADLAQRVFIAHAAPGSKTETFACRLAESGKPLLTLDGPANGNLMDMGAMPFQTREIGPPTALPVQSRY